MESSREFSVDKRSRNLLFCFQSEEGHLLQQRQQKYPHALARAGVCVSILIWSWCRSGVVFFIVFFIGDDSDSDNANNSESDTDSTVHQSSLCSFVDLAWWKQHLRVL